MILDKLTEFADAVSVAAGTGTALIGNQIDLGSIGRDIGNGEPIYLVILASTGIITGGAAGTIQFSLASDSTAAIDTAGGATVHFTTKAFVTDDDALNELDAGAVIACVALPLQGPTYERYLGILCTIGTTTVTAGAIDAFLTLDPRGWKAYPDAQN